MGSRSRTYLGLALVLLATGLMYLSSLNNPFVTDDRAIILNNFGSGRDWSVRDLFKRNLFGTAPAEYAYFRPLTLLTFGLNYQLAGETPRGYRLWNIALHLLAIVLAFLFVSLLSGTWTATFTALLFALHPALVQAVSYISSRSEPLYTGLALLCLLLWHKGNNAGGDKRGLYFGLALSSFFVGLFVKETMIVVPALAIIMDFTWNPGGSWHVRMRQNLAWYPVFLILFTIYLFIRISAGFPLSMVGDVEIPFESKLLLGPKVFFLYLQIIFYPLHLHLFRTVLVPQSFFEWEVILGTLLLGAFALFAYLFWSIRREVSFGLLWFLVSMTPYLNLILLNAPIMEHWLYLPLIGFTLATVAGVRYLAEQVGEARGAALALFLVALLLSARTTTRNAEWGDPAKVLFKDALFQPGNYLAWFWLGDAFKERGRQKEAIHAFKAGLAIKPDSGRAWADLGESLSLTGADYAAESAFTRAIRLSPEDPSPYHMLGVHLLKLRRYREAVEVLAKSLDLKPSAGGYHALASAHLKLGQKEKAEEAFGEALTLHPQALGFHAQIHVNFGKLHQGQGNLKDAQEEWKLALRFDPNHAEARTLLEEQAK